MGSVVLALSLEPPRVRLDHLHELQEGCSGGAGDEWGFVVIGIDGAYARLVFPLRGEGFVPGVQLASYREPPGHDSSPVVVVERVLELEVLAGDFTGIVDLGVVVFGPDSEDVSGSTAVPGMLNEVLVDVAGAV